MIKVCAFVQQCLVVRSLSGARIVDIESSLTYAYFSIDSGGAYGMSVMRRSYYVLYSGTDGWRIIDCPTTHSLLCIIHRASECCLVADRQKQLYDELIITMSSRRPARPWENARVRTQEPFVLVREGLNRS